MKGIPTKVCASCGVDIPLFNFTRNKASYDGLAHKCKDCVKKTKGLTELDILRQNVPEKHW